MCVWALLRVLNAWAQTCDLGKVRKTRLCKSSHLPWKTEMERKLWFYVWMVHKVYWTQILKADHVRTGVFSHFTFTPLSWWRWQSQRTMSADKNQRAWTRHAMQLTPAYYLLAALSKWTDLWSKTNKSITLLTQPNIKETAARHKT